MALLFILSSVAWAQEDDLAVTLRQLRERFPQLDVRDSSPMVWNQRKYKSPAELDIMRKVGIPRSLPYFFGSLKVAITLAFVGTTVSEMTASNEGIGYLLISAGSSMQMGLAFSGLVVVGAILIVAMMQESYRLAFHDELTGLPGRRASAPQNADRREFTTLLNTDPKV